MEIGRQGIHLNPRYQAGVLAYACVCRFLSRAVPDFVQVTLNRIYAVLSPVEFGALEQGGAKMAALTPEELKKMKDDGR